MCIARNLWKILTNLTFTDVLYLPQLLVFWKYLFVTVYSLFFVCGIHLTISQEKIYHQVTKKTPQSIMNLMQTVSVCSNQSWSCNKKLVKILLAETKTLTRNLRNILFKVCFKLFESIPEVAKLHSHKKINLNDEVVSNSRCGTVNL